MRLATLQIENFRAFKKATIAFDKYTCIVGANGAGKSCVFAALNVLFKRPTSRNALGDRLFEEDFHKRNTSLPIQVTATFTNLTDAELSALTQYVRGGSFTFKAVAKWDVEHRHATVEQVSPRNVILEFAPWFAKFAQKSTRAPELKELFQLYREKYPGIAAAATKDAMHDALRAFEAANTELTSEQDVPEDFYGAAGAEGLLNPFLQWVHVPAVKDATDEEAEARAGWFGQLVARAVRAKVDFEGDLEKIRSEARAKYEAMVSGQQGSLEELSQALTSRLSGWAHPDAVVSLKWFGDSEKSISVTAPIARVDAGDGTFVGALSRHGHGFQRSYLLALLQELSSGGSPAGSLLLLGVEEPELYQHPPQARHLAAVLENLSNGSTQVAVCSHSPYFVSGRGFQDIRIVRRTPSDGASVASATLDSVQALMKKATGKPSTSLEGTRIRLHQQLQPSANEIFFAPMVVLVEGLEDAAYLHSHLELTGIAGEFRRLGCHVLPANRKSDIPLLAATANVMGIPYFVMFDADVDQCEEKPGATDKEKQTVASRRGPHERDNHAVFVLAGHESQKSLPDADVWLPNLTCWRTNLTNTLEAELGAALEAARTTVRTRHGMTDQASDKSALFIGEVMEEMYSKGKSSTLLEKLCSQILARAESAQGKKPGASPPAVAA